MGKTPTASTVGTHVSAINRVFDEGIERGYVSPQKRPHIFNRGMKGVSIRRRPQSSCLT
jgi:hypothetical protein